MRVLVVSPTAQVSGAETVLLRAVTAMDRCGWDVTAATPPGPLVERLAALGIGHCPLPDLKLPSGPPPAALTLLGFRTLRASARLRRLARECDVVLVNGFLALPALRLSRCRTPVAWLVHDVLHRSSWLRVLRFSRVAVSLAVAVSEAVARPLLDAGLTVQVIPNGTPWPVESIPGHPSEPPVVGCAAMLTSWKGQYVLLDAIGHSQRTDALVELAGGTFPKDGAYVSGLEGRATQPDLAGRVRFLGSVADPLARIRTWTIAVLASVDPEACPLAVLEAMSIGVPVIATDHGGPREIVGSAGLLVPPRDVSALTNAIERLLTDSALWERCHVAGPARVRDHYVLSTQIRLLLDELELLAHAATS